MTEKKEKAKKQTEKKPPQKPLFPVILHDGNDWPDSDIFYLIAKNGVFLKKKTELVDSLTPVNQISVLHPVDTYAAMNIKKIPTNLFAYIVGLFKAVYEEHKAECIVIFHYNETTKKWRLEVPPQEVSGAAADYTSTKQYTGYTRIGTIHSHAGMGAFHSGTDDADEAGFDGLHITLGNMGSDGFSMSASVVLNGLRVKINGADYIEGIYPLYEQRTITHGKHKGQKKKKERAYPVGHYMSKTNGLWSINEKLQKQFPKAWMKRIEGRVTATGYYVGGAYNSGVYNNRHLNTNGNAPARNYSTGYYTYENGVRTWNEYGSERNPRPGDSYPGRSMGFACGNSNEKTHIIDDDPCKKCVWKGKKAKDLAAAVAAVEFTDEEILEAISNMDDTELADYGLKSMSVEEMCAHEEVRAKEEEAEGLAELETIQFGTDDVTDEAAEVYDEGTIWLGDNDIAPEQLKDCRTCVEDCAMCDQEATADTPDNDTSHTSTIDADSATQEQIFETFFSEDGTPIQYPDQSLDNRDIPGVHNLLPGGKKGYEH